MRVRLVVGGGGGGGESRLTSWFTTVYNSGCCRGSLFDILLFE